ncbi:MAG: hypothetical protein Q8932_12795 [Bacteroidota bacterium]|nr:hypothetical protein [Bacteroidota bacterium]MDP4246717.1 hypothetical protein [Bacteroidota bacterium]MDP4252554.1 hypothetical protein [Bacteroidota bacterium]
MHLENRKTVFISGSAYEYGRFGEIGKPFIKHLSRALLKNGFRIVSGFGLGVGAHVVEGAIDEIHLERKEPIRDQLQCFPFPHQTRSPAVWSAYRNDMIARADTAVFLFGNKLQDIFIRDADGVLEEFEIARSNQAAVIPVGVSGYAAEKLWKRVVNEFDDFYPCKDKRGMVEQLGDPSVAPEDLIDLIIRIAS